MDPTKTEVTQDELECKMKNEKFNNLTKFKRTASRGRGDIFITKTDQGGLVVIVDVKH